MVSIDVAARAEFEFLHHHPDNQTIAHKLITLPILYILLERPTDDSDEITIQFAHNVSTLLAEHSPNVDVQVSKRFCTTIN